MRRRPLLLGACLLIGPAPGSEPPAPSLDLLLYLAEWVPDENGRLTDPLEVPEELDPRTEVPFAEQDASSYPVREDLR